MDNTYDPFGYSSDELQFFEVSGTSASQVLSDLHVFDLDNMLLVQ